MSSIEEEMPVDEEQVYEEETEYEETPMEEETSTKETSSEESFFETNKLIILAIGALIAVIVLFFVIKNIPQVKKFFCAESSDPRVLLSSDTAVPQVSNAPKPINKPQTSIVKTA